MIFHSTVLVVQHATAITHYQLMMTKARSNSLKGFNQKKALLGKAPTYPCCFEMMRLNQPSASLEKISVDSLSLSHFLPS